jgi:HD-like signal output (HDOD) protein
MSTQLGEESACSQGQDVPAGAAETGLRSALIWIQKALLDVDRLDDAEAVVRRLWILSRGMRLRTMLLHESGRSLQADAAEGFAALDGDPGPALAQVVAPLDPQGLFAAVAAEKTVYSGPRPRQGLPVDLILRMGKESPAWCLLIPLPQRRRWGRFLYVDAMPAQLEDILRLDPVARFAVLQLRAAQRQPHRPGLRVRSFQESALRDRLTSSRGSELPSGAEDPTVPDAPRTGIDRLSRKRHPVRDAFPPPAPERFDEQGRLIQPLPAAEIESRVGSLPQLPPTASLVLSLLDDPETTVTALEEVLGGDPDLQQRFLHIANSSQFGALRACDTVSEAIVRLGFSAIRSWLLATATRKLFLPGEASATQRALWQQSVVAAVAAQRLAEQSQVTDGETGFVGGLLQNVGMLLMAQDHREVFEAMLTQASEAGQPLHEVERARLGFDHADLSALLLARWGLPGQLVEAVRLHHRLDTAEEHERLAALIALAEALAQQAAAKEAPGALLESREATLLGLQPRDVTELSRRLEPMLLDTNLMS